MFIWHIPPIGLPVKVSTATSMFFLTTVTPLCYGMFFPVSEDKNSKYPKGYVLWSVLLTIWSVLLTFLD